ncbi:MAG: hypothetical protein ACRD2N_01200 [Vicinamibacterales bacterium]
MPTLVVVVIAAVALLYARGGEGRGDTLERAYVAIAGLPLALSILAPLAIGLSWGYGPSSKWWIDRLGWAGLVLSLALGSAGVVLIGRSAACGRRWAWPLGAAVVIAAAPGMLVVVSVGLLWCLGKIWR